MKTIDEREMQKATKEKANKDRKEQEEGKLVKGWEINDFVVHLS